MGRSFSQLLALSIRTRGQLDLFDPGPGLDQSSISPISKIDGFALKQCDGEAETLDSLVQILAIDVFRTIVKIIDELGGGKPIVTCFGKQVVTVDLLQFQGDGDDAL